MSSTSPSRAYSRYCAVAQMQGRPLVPSMAEMAAPRPLPPKRKPPLVMTPGVTSSDHRKGLWLGRRPRNERESIAGGL